MRDEVTEKLGREVAAEARKAAAEAAELVARGDERGYVKRDSDDDH